MSESTIAVELKCIEDAVNEIIGIAKGKGLTGDDINLIVDMMEKSEERLVTLLSDFGLEFGDERVD